MFPSSQATPSSHAAVSSQTAPGRQARRRSLGFTLLEVIVIIMVGGLLAALVVNLMGTQLLRSTSPSTIAADAGDAEALMEAVVADYTFRINNNATANVLNNMVAAYSTNATVNITDTASWGSPPSATGLRVLTVTTNVGNTSYTTLLTQARTNDADNATNF
ncbi:MAG: prepilin-type N-terminal cleavage/methylation domain-containing protein [Humidesulfovibrio sp.]|nr:prepilin-type N-terminal cleavage/methylation domain-containing protein [Humidesulfovibrio sp.]